MNKTLLVNLLRVSGIGISLAGAGITASAGNYDVASSGNWTTGATWSPTIAGGPSSGDSIVGENAGFREVALDGAANTAYTVSSLSNSGSSALTFLNLAGSGNKTLNVTGNIVQNSSGNLTFSATGSQQFSLTVGGNLSVQSGTVVLGVTQSLGTLEVIGTTEVHQGAGIQVGTDTRPVFTGNVILHEGAQLNIYRPRAAASFPRIDIGGLSGDGQIAVTSDSGNRVNNMRFNFGSGDHVFHGDVVTTVPAGTLMTEMVRNGAAGAQILRGEIGSHTGTTLIQGGVLAFAGNANLTTGNIDLNNTVAGIGSILGIGSSDLVRNLGTAAGEIRLIGTAAGFAAYDHDRTVTLGASELSWGQANFSMGVLVLGHSSADATVELTNGIDLNGAARTVRVGNGSAAIDGRLSGVLEGNASSQLTVSGEGALELTGANTYEGGTVVSSGASLYVNNLSGSATGSGAVLVEEGALLGGSGFISGSVQVDGILSPGNSIGTLSVGEIVVGSTGTLAFELGVNGGLPASDLIVASDLVYLGAGANLALTQLGSLGQATAGDVFFLINNEGADDIVGIFTSLNGVATDLSQGAQLELNGYEWLISYQADFDAGTFLGGNGLALQLVSIPEPGTYALFIGLGIFSVILRRRR